MQDCSSLSKHCPSVLFFPSKDVVVVKSWGKFLSSSSSSGDDSFLWLLHEWWWESREGCIDDVTGILVFLFSGQFKVNQRHSVIDVGVSFFFGIRFLSKQARWSKNFDPICWQETFWHLTFVVEDSFFGEKLVFLSLWCCCLDVVFLCKTENLTCKEESWRLEKKILILLLITRREEKV